MFLQEQQVLFKGNNILLCMLCSLIVQLNLNSIQQHMV